MQGLDKIRSDMTEFGLVIVDALIDDGKIHRVKDGHDDDGEAGWYIGSRFFSKKTADPIYSFVFGSWKKHETQTSCSVSEKSKEHKNDIKKEIDKLQKKIASETKEKNREAKEKAASLFDSLETQGTHPYLEKKQIDGLYGARLNKNPNQMSLVIPMRDVNGEIHSVQSIFSDSRGKRFLAGGRVDGLFHLIGEIGSSEKLVICEGFATGVSIHISTGLPVACAFNAANLVSVSTSIREKYPDIALVVAGDDDYENEENTGKEKAEEAAKKSLGKAVFPLFQNEKNRGTDFNDLFCLEGKDAVANLFSGAKQEPLWVEPLGYNHDKFFLVSSLNKQVQSLSSSELETKAGLNRLQPIEYWEVIHPAKNGSVDTSRAGSDLKTKCIKRGVFSDSNLRGRGVWSDGVKTVYHCGDSIYLGNKKNSLYRNNLDLKHIYELSKTGPRLSASPMSKDEMEALFTSFRTINWQDNTDACLLAGWIAVASIGGCMEWRPHVWLTGESGSGKSYIMQEIINKLLKGYCNFTQGKTTEAGIRQAFGKSTMPIIFDEFETNDVKSGERISSILELARQASSDSDGVVLHGSSDSTGVQYKPVFSMLVSSVRVSVVHREDDNRFTRIVVVPRENNQEKVEIFDELRTFYRDLPSDISDRIFARSFLMSDTIKKSYDVIKGVISTHSSTRNGQQYGSLLAGYWSWISDEVITQEMAQQLYDLISHRFTDIHTDDSDLAPEDTDSNDCRDHLMSTAIMVPTSEGLQRKSIGELVNNFFKNPLEEKYILSILETYGITISHVSAKEGRMVCVWTKHPEIKKIYKGEKWLNVSEQLLRANGSLKHVARFRNTNRSQRVIAIEYVV